MKFRPSLFQLETRENPSGTDSIPVIDPIGLPDVPPPVVAPVDPAQAAIDAATAIGIAAGTLINPVAPPTGPSSVPVIDPYTSAH